MSDTSRRDFLKTATTAAVATAVAPKVDFFPAVHAAGSDAIRVGLIGCGGRGTGAADDVLSSADGVTLVAMGDVFPDRLTASRDRLRQKFADKIAVTDDRSFTGFDAYKKVLASDINYVILATPPGFRPTHLSAAVAAGTQRRHQTGYIETMRRIHDGSIGNIVGARCYWNQGFLWKKDRQPDWSDMEWQLRNWLYFTWLSGDHIVEQHVHNIDVVNWAMQAHPVRAVGMGGRQVRTGPEYGHIFDHFAIDYEYANGTRLMSMCRQIEGCEKNVSEALVGDKGSCQTEADKSKYEITGPRAWRFTAQDSRPYVQEHTDFIASIRAGKPLNELKTVAESTLTAIMGRMSAYTGKAVTWDQALNSQEPLVPANMTFGPIATPPVAVPGQTPLV